MRPFRVRPYASLRRLVLVALSMGTLVAAAVGASAVMGIGGAWTSNQRAAVGDIVSPYQQHLLGHNKVPSKLVPKLDKQRAVRCARPAYPQTHAAYCPAMWASLGKGRQGARPAREGRPAHQAGGRPGPGRPDRPLGRPVRHPAARHPRVMLPTGKVLWFAYPDSTHTLDEASAWVWDPTTGRDQAGQPADQPGTGRPVNIWCGGHTLLPDGRVVVAGGNLEYAASPTPVGWRASTCPDLQPVQRDLDPAARHAHGRWYPTLTTLPDGRVIIFSGLDERQQQRSTTTSRCSPRPPT